MYDNFPISPFSFGSCMADWRKVVCCPRRINSRMNWWLFLRANNEDLFNTIVRDRGEKILPDEMKEQSVTLFQKPEESSINDSSRQSDPSYAERSNTKIPEWAFAPAGKHHKSMKRSTIVRKEKNLANFAE